MYLIGRHFLSTSVFRLLQRCPVELIELGLGHSKTLIFVLCSFSFIDLGVYLDLLRGLIYTIWHITKVLEAGIDRYLEQWTISSTLTVRIHLKKKQPQPPSFNFAILCFSMCSPIICDGLHHAWFCMCIFFGFLITILHNDQITFPLCISSVKMWKSQEKQTKTAKRSN